MFIRETIKLRKNKRYVQHKLVESIRTLNGPRQRIVLNLGKINLSKNKWKELANAIEDELHGQQSLFPQDSEIKGLAKHYAKLIIRERLNNQLANTQQVKQQPKYEKVDTNTIATSNSRSIGCEHIVLKQLEES